MCQGERKTETKPLKAVPVPMLITAASGDLVGATLETIIEVGVCAKVLDGARG